MEGKKLPQITEWFKTWRNKEAKTFNCICIGCEQQWREDKKEKIDAIQEKHFPVCPRNPNRVIPPDYSGTILTA